MFWKALDEHLMLSWDAEDKMLFRILQDELKIDLVRSKTIGS